MILYDDKYNFLGMSSDTLGFLGYEDIGEFLSQHNDFANLFVNKEGYIYKFDNFAWIDFVLYSGSANKKAIVTLKNGQETEISVSIKELFLAKEIENSKKLYSVKVISDNFNEISGTPKDTSNIKKSIGGFSLGGLVKKEQKAEKESIKEINEFASLIEENKIVQENSNNGGFILNIADNELISKDNIIPETKEIKDNSEDFKLNFSNNDMPLEKEPVLDLLKIDEVKEKPILDLLKIDEVKEEPILDLLKIDEVKEEPILDLLKNDEVKEKPVLDLLKSDEIKEKPVLDLLKSDKIKEDFKFDFPKNISNSEPMLDFLKNSDQKEEELPIQNEQEASKEPMIFNLLNEDKKEESEKKSTFEFNLSNEDASKEEQSSDSNFSFKKAKEPLSLLIEEDTDETKLDLIPKVEKETTNLELNFLKVDKEDTTQETNLELNFLNTTNKEEKNENQEGLKNKKEIIKQIKKDIKEIDTQPKSEEFKLVMPDTQQTQQKLNFLNQEIQESSEIKSEDKSFTNTLNDLFNNDNQENNTISTKQDEVMPSFINEVKKDNIENFNPLTSLGLSADDEFELMSDFISDTNESIAVIEEFIKTDNLDKINYPLVKIKSSAEILNLDAIIDISNIIREETLNKNSENVINHINTLRERIEFLEKNLTKTVA